MKRTRKFRIGQMKNPQKVDLQQSRASIAQQYMYAQQKLNPLIIAQKMNPPEAVVLIACYAHAVINGNENNPSHKMTEKEIIGASNLLLHLWKIGLFQPSSDFPFTLEQILTEFEDKS